MAPQRPSRYDAIISVADEVLALKDVAYYQQQHYHSIIAILKDIRPIKQDYYALGREISNYCSKHNTTKEALRRKYLDSPVYTLNQIGYITYIHATEEVVVKLLSSVLHRMKTMYGGETGKRNYELLKEYYFDPLPMKDFVHYAQTPPTILYKGVPYNLRTFQRWRKEAVEKYAETFFGLPNNNIEMDVHITTEVVKRYIERIRRAEAEAQKQRDMLLDS